METVTYEVKCIEPGFGEVTIPMHNEIEARRYVKNQIEAFPDSGIVYKIIKTTIKVEEI